jgi:hypothetical protein
MRVTGRGYWKGAKMCLGRCCGSEKTGHLKGRTAHLKGRTEHLKGRAKHLAGRVTGRDCGIIRVTGRPRTLREGGLREERLREEVKGRASFPLRSGLNLSPNPLLVV